MIDHDRLFKELITTFFWEFLELFTPTALEYIAQKSVDFLPEETFTDVTSGEKRKIDILAKVKYQGKDTCFVIHIENQSYNQSKFERRMFNYFARLHEKYQLPIYPVVVFSYDRPLRPEKSQYKLSFPDLNVLEFNYIAIQLNRLNWRTFLNNPNPIAAALMSKMNFTKEERPRVKLECLRMLATLQVDPARMQLISGFVDIYLRLNKTENQIFETQLKEIGLVEEEKIMEIVTSWMEVGIEKGINQEAKKLVTRLIKRRFGDISPDIETRINNLPLDQVELLGENLFDFSNQDDLITWLNTNN